MLISRHRKDGQIGKRRRRESLDPTWLSYRQAFRLFLTGVTVVPAAKIAVVVGTWLSLMNQGRLIVDGHPPWVKLILNYATPFTVATLGFLAGRRRRNVERLVALLLGGSRGSEDLGPEG